MWRNERVEQTIKLFNGPISWPDLKHKNGEILAVEGRGTMTKATNNMYVLDDEIKIKQRFNGYGQSCVDVIDFSQTHIISGHTDGTVELINRHSSERKKVIISLRISLIRVFFWYRSNIHSPRFF